MILSGQDIEQRRTIDKGAVQDLIRILFGPLGEADEGFVDRM